MKPSKSDKIEVLAYLRKMCPPGTTIYTVMRHRSRSGMSCALDVYVIKSGEPLRVTWSVAHATRSTYSRKHEAVIVNGCGLDAGFHLVNMLSYALHGMQSKGDGALPENAGRPFTPRREHYRAGYSLNHQWM